MLYLVRQITRIDGKVYYKGEKIEIADPKISKGVYMSIKSRTLTPLEDILPKKVADKMKADKEILPEKPIIEEEAKENKKEKKSKKKGK